MVPQGCHQNATHDTRNVWLNMWNVCFIFHKSNRITMSSWHIPPNRIEKGRLHLRKTRSSSKGNLRTCWQTCFQPTLTNSAPIKAYSDFQTSTDRLKSQPKLVEPWQCEIFVYPCKRGRKVVAVTLELYNSTIKQSKTSSPAGQLVGWLAAWLAACWFAG